MKKKSYLIKIKEGDRLCLSGGQSYTLLRTITSSVLFSLRLASSEGDSVIVSASGIALTNFLPWSKRSFVAFCGSVTTGGVGRGLELEASLGAVMSAVSSASTASWNSGSEGELEMELLRSASAGD